MSLERTQQTMNHHFEVMDRGGDFAEFYTADVTWTTTDTGQDVRGPSSIRDFIVALHNNMSDAQRGGSASRMDTHILKATVWRRPPELTAGSLTALLMTLLMTESQPCAATVRSLLCVRSSVPIGASSLGAQAGVIAAADLTLLLPDANEIDDGSRPPHPVRPDFAPLLAAGVPPSAIAAFGAATTSLGCCRCTDGSTATSPSSQLVLGLLRPRAHPGSGSRGGGASAPAAVVACRRARRVPGGPQAARRVSSVISLGAKIRNGGPQKPVPRLV